MEPRPRPARRGARPSGPRAGRLPGGGHQRRPLRAVRRLRPHRRGMRSATRCPWSRTPPRRSAPPTAAGPPAPSATVGRVLVQRQQDHHHQWRRDAARRATRALVARARYLATQARDPALHYEHSQIGYAYRMSNLLAAARPRRSSRGLPAKIARRRDDQRALPRGARRPARASASCPSPTSATPNCWLTVVTLGPAIGTTPAELCAHLETHDIEARPAWKPLHLQPVFADAPMRGGAVAEAIFREGLCLPEWLGDDRRRRRPRHRRDRDRLASPPP